MIDDLTPQQAGALVRFIDRNGFQWKSQLYKLWQDIKIKKMPCAADQALLRQIRNSFGHQVERTYTAEVKRLREISGETA